jgi:hypothetical protein
LAWMDFYGRCRNGPHTCRHFGISRQTFYRWQRRYDPYDLTTLEERSHCPRQRRLPTWSFLSRRKGFEVAVAVSTLGQRQAGGSPAPPEVGGFDFHGGPHSHSSEAARSAGGTAAHGSSGIAPRSAFRVPTRCANPSNTRCRSPATWSKFVNLSAIAAATATAKRVFPAPPGPVRLNNRISPRSNNSAACATCCSRPTSEVRGIGRSWRFLAIFAGDSTRPRDKSEGSVIGK